MRYTRHSLAALSFVLVAACGGSEPGSTGGTQPTSTVSVVVVTPSSATIDLGGTQTFSFEARTSAGTAVSGKTATWASSNTSAVTIDASGVARGVAIGSAIISATIDGKLGVATVTVSAPAVSSVTLSATSTSLIAGNSVAVQAALKDKIGTTLTGRAVTWSSASVRVASVDPNGVVTGVSAGSTAITATSEGVSGTITIVVTAPAGSVAPTISGVSPASLSVGATATISGANFIATPANNLVFIAGKQATVTAATSTQLTVTVPSSIGCQSTQQVNVEVTTVGGTGTAKQTLVSATQRALAVGGSVLLTASQAIGCNELTAAGTYVVTVVNASKTVGTTSSFELKGTAGSAAVADVRPNLLATPHLSGFQTIMKASHAAASQWHLQHLAFERQLRQELGFPRHASRAGTSQLILRGGSGVAQQLPASVPLTVGATATVRFNLNSCSTAASPQISGRVVYVGPQAIVVEDNTSALAGKIDADLIAMAKDWEDVSYPILQNFGNIFAYDDSLTTKGHIIMMFTPRVNAAGADILGFVQTCDMYNPALAASVSGSNQASIFYARVVTDTTAASTSLNGRPLWKRLMPATLIHESKHILANAERNATPILTDDEQPWLEEATAQLASELYGRAIHGNSWKSNAPYNGVLDCEFKPTVPSCNGAARVMENHYGWLTDFLTSFETESVIGDQPENYYGGAWLFTRWLVDTYGGATESVALQKLIRNFTNFGVDNVTNVSGKTWAELISQYSTMLATDEVSTAPSIFQEPSWNLPAVWAGFNTLSPTNYPLLPLTVRQSGFASSFSTGGLTLGGGGAMVLRLNAGGSGTQLLDLHDVNLNPLGASSPIALSILRIQ